MAARTKFDAAAFIAGVGRPTRDVQLCTDMAARTRMDAIMRDLSELPKPGDDEPLAGDGRREKLLDDLRAIQEDDATWTTFTIQAPTRNGRIASARVLAASDDMDADSLLAAEAELIADCLVGIAGEPVIMVPPYVRVMQAQWPDDLVREILDAIRELGGDVTSVPFSRRVSESLATPER